MSEPNALTIRAELVSFGGGILLTLCLLATAGLLVVLLRPDMTGVQQFIGLALFVFTWLFLIQSTTEVLTIDGEDLVFRARLRREHRFALAEIQTVQLFHRGFSLEGGLHTIEVRRPGKKMDSISLGPCWSREKLDLWLEMLEEGMQGGV